MRPEFEPRDHAYERRVRDSFAKQKAMSSLGVSVGAIGPGWVEFGLRKRESFTQQHEYIHAGALATAMDSACGYAAFSLMPADAAVLTVEYKVNFLRPAKHDHYVINGWVVKPGRTLTICQANALAFPDGETIAVMTGTIMTVMNRDIEG